ncbi:MAG: C-terminal binding protein [Sedimentibacter sp.]
MKVVICDYEFENVEPEKEALKTVPNLEFFPDAQCKTEEEVIELTKDADGVLNQWNHITANVIDNMKNCKVIATYGIGTDKIDVEAASKKGIYVCNVPAYGTGEVANHAFSMILACSRQLVQYDRLIRQGKFGYPTLGKKLYRLDGQTVGVVGFGKIPRNLSRKLMDAFNMKILAYDPYITEEFAKECGVTKVDLETLMKESDFVSVHVPLTKETKYLINEKMLRMMKTTAYLINCGRGAIVKEDDLAKVLKENAIAGAGIDVFEIEPISPDDPLMQLDNVIVTPHSAYYTVESLYALQYGAAAEVARVLKGEEPLSAVNKKQVDDILKK